MIRNLIRARFARQKRIYRTPAGRNRRSQVERLEARRLLAGTITQVNEFETWNGPNIDSTDPAGITYKPDLQQPQNAGHLFIADSEINELNVFNGDNIFEVSLNGNTVFNEIQSFNTEPTGITYNQNDGYFYVTNDNTYKIQRYDDSLNNPLAEVVTTVPSGNPDPEGITSNPANGDLYVTQGVRRIVQRYDKNLQFISEFSVSSLITDPEGIAFDPGSQHLFLVSERSMKILEVTLSGSFVEEYPIDHFSPRPVAPQGLTIGPTSNPNDGDTLAFYIADGMVDNGKDGRIYEAVIGLSGGNLAPIAQDDPVNTDPAIPVLIDVLADNGNGPDTDADGNLVPSTTTPTSLPSDGTLVNNGDGTFLYTPDSGFFGTDSFTYTVEDDDGVLSNEATVTITVNVNQPPVAQEDSTFTNQDSPITISVLLDNGNGPDADSDGTLVPSTTAQASPAANGSLVNNGDGTFLYAPDTGFTGTDSFTYTVQDNDGALSNAATVTITVNPPLSLLFSLRSADTLPGGLTVANEDIVAYDGVNFSLLFDGSDVGLSGARLDALSALNANEYLMSFASAETVPGISGEVDDSDIVKFTATQLGNSTTGSFEVYFDGSDVGLTGSGEDVDALDILADGRLVLSTIGSFDVNGVTGNDEDLLAFTPATLGENTAGTWDIYFDGSDVEIGGEDVDALSLDGNGNLNLSTSDTFAVTGVAGEDEDVFVFAPTLLGDTTNGSYLAALVFDGSAFGLAADNDVWSIDVPGSADPNDPPVAEDDAVNTPEDMAITIDVLADNGNGADSDPDAALAPASTTEVVLPSDGTLVNNGDGTFLYTPVLNFNGTDSFTYTVMDDDGATSNEATVTITVADVNDPPIAQNDAVSTPENVAITINVLGDNGNGIDGDVDGTLVPASVTELLLPTDGTLVNNGDGTFLYTPDATFLGTDSFTYTVDDDDSATSNVATVTIDVTENNIAPVAQDDAVNSLEDTALTISVLLDNGNGPDTDVDGVLVPTTTIEVGLPTDGTLVNNGDGTFLYTPDLNFHGTDSFTYTVDDEDGATSNEATVMITIDDVNDPPLARDDDVSTVEDTAITISVLAANGNGPDSDVDGILVPATTTAIGMPTDGTLVNNGDGTFLYTPDTGFLGTDSFTYTVDDDDGTASNEATVTVHVLTAPSLSTLYFALRIGDSLPGGLTVENEDIIAWDGMDFSLFFDGSDVGLGGVRIDALSVVSGTEILMSFAEAEAIPGIAGTVDDSDIVKFTATGTGETTSGTFELYIDGSDVGLESGGEDINGLDVLADGRLLISTHGSFRVPGVSGRDEDIIAFTVGTTGDNTTGTWAMYFDGSDVDLGDEDVDAISVDGNGNLGLSTQESFAVTGLAGDEEDVFTFEPLTFGVPTAGTYDPILVFDGSLFGLATDNDVWAIDFAAAQPAAQSVAQSATGPVPPINNRADSPADEYFESLEDNQLGVVLIPDDKTTASGEPHVTAPDLASTVDSELQSSARIAAIDDLFTDPIALLDLVDVGT